MGAIDWVWILGPWGWLLALVPIGIIALYFLKLRREPVEVSSTLLWGKTIQDLHVNSLLQRLRRSLLLFLQLLIVAARCARLRSARHTWGELGSESADFITRSFSQHAGYRLGGWCIEVRKSETVNSWANSSRFRMIRLQC